MDERESRDGGFTLLEAVIAMVVFGIVAASTAAVLVRAVGTSSDNRARAAAANIAAQAMDAMRASAESGDGFTGLVSQALPDVPVQGRTYHVYQNVTPIIGSSNASPCVTSSISNQTFKKVGIVVTWADSGAVQPVRSDTLVQNPGVTADKTKGALGVVVTGPTGAAVPRLTVTLGGGRTTLTDDSGCAYFDGLDASSGSNTYQATVTATGHVAPDGSTAARGTQSVQAGYVSLLQLSYAPVTAATLVFGPLRSDGTTDASYNTLPSTPATAYTLVSGSNALTGSTTSTSVSRSLYPYTAGYSAYLGTSACSEQIPSAPNNFASEPGTRISTAVATAGLTLTNGSQTAKTVTLSNQTSTCKAGQGAVTYQVQVSPGTTKLVLPFGTWKVTPNGGVPSSVVMSQSIPTETVVLS